MIPGDKSYYEGTDILQNRFDIRNAATLRAVEYKFTTAREAQLRSQPAPHQFDFEHLKAIHKQVFQDVYDWAGQVRNVDIAKRNQKTGQVNSFVPAMVLDIKAEDFNKLLQDKKYLKGLNKEEFVDAITEVHTKLNELHPFREGNGRSARIFLVQLSKQAGYEFDLTKVHADGWNMASHKALRQYDPKDEKKWAAADSTDMRKLFSDTIRPTLAHAFTVEARDQAIKLRPELAHAFARMDAIEQFISRRPGTNGESLLTLERTRIVSQLEQNKIPPLQPYLQGRFGAQSNAASMSLAAKNMNQDTAVATKGRGMRA